MHRLMRRALPWAFLCAAVLGAALIFKDWVTA